MIGTAIGSPRRRRGRSRWRFLLLLLACAAFPGVASAQAYLILSLIGDHLTTVTEGPRTVGDIDSNQYGVTRLGGTALEDYVVRTADAAIRRAAPSASVTMLRASDPKLYASSDRWFDISPEQIHTLATFVAKAVPSTPDARLVLIAPYLAQPQMRAPTDYRGSGSVAGLGFYVSNRFQRGQGIAGFLGVFANFQLVLVNLRTEAIERREIVVVGTAYAAARAPDGLAANALSPEQKIKALQGLVADEIERRLPAMLAPAKP